MREERLEERMGCRNCGRNLPLADTPYQRTAQKNEGEQLIEGTLKGDTSTSSQPKTSNAVERQ